jgi:hypothetical protein
MAEGAEVARAGEQHERETSTLPSHADEIQGIRVQLTQIKGEAPPEIYVAGDLSEDEAIEVIAAAVRPLFLRDDFDPMTFQTRLAQALMDAMSGA